METPNFDQYSNPEAAETIWTLYLGELVEANYIKEGMKILSECSDSEILEIDLESLLGNSMVEGRSLREVGIKAEDWEE